MTIVAVDLVHVIFESTRKKSYENSPTTFSKKGLS